MDPTNTSFGRMDKKLDILKNTKTVSVRKPVCLHAENTKLKLFQSTEEILTKFKETIHCANTVEFFSVGALTNGQQRKCLINTDNRLVQWFKDVSNR